MNKTILTGRLTRDPDVRKTQGENPITATRFTLAVERKYKRAGDSQDADFISCIAFSKLGDFVDKYFKQGMKMNLVGRLQSGSYTNKEGIKIYTTDVIAEEIEFGEKKGSNSADSNLDNPSDEGFMNIPEGLDEELPFN